MERTLEANLLTTADVARRLGVQGGTVRYYGKLLRERGYPLVQGPNEEWLWPPEVVEVARAAHALARAVNRTTFEKALDYLEYVGRLAVRSREGMTMPEVLGRLDRLPERLAQVVPRLEEGVERVLDRMRGDAALTLVRVVEDLRREVMDLLSTMGRRAERFEGAVLRAEGLLDTLVVLPSLALLVVSGLLTLGVLGKLGFSAWLSGVGVLGLFLAGFLLGRVSSRSS